MKYTSILFLAASALIPTLSFAQSGKVLKGLEVNESAIVEALAPEPASAGLVKTRSIRIKPVDEPPSKQPSASMLVTFETNSAELTPKAKQMLDVLGRALQSDKLAQFKFSIEGHADPRGGEQFNLQLSQLRAKSVVKYLSESQKIDQGRLMAVGKGQSELMNTTNPVAPENRRVTVKTMVN